MNNIFQFIQSFRNPQAMIQNIMSNNEMMQNPMLRSGIELYQKGDMKGGEQLVRNICKERGIDIDEMRKQLGI